MSAVVVEIAIGDPELARRVRRLLGALARITIWDGAGDSFPDVTIASEMPDEEMQTPCLVIAAAPDQLVALRAGAAGVLAPGAGAGELEASIAAVARGLRVMEDDLAQRLVAGAFAADLPEVAGEAEDRPHLSQRELEVLTLLADGATNKMIARELAISVHTAKFHVAQLIAKLGAATRTDVVARAVRIGLLML